MILKILTSFLHVNYLIKISNDGKRPKNLDIFLSKKKNTYLKEFQSYSSRNNHFFLFVRYSILAKFFLFLRGCNVKWRSSKNGTAISRCGLDKYEILTNLWSFGLYFFWLRVILKISRQMINVIGITYFVHINSLPFNTTDWK